MTRWRPTGDPVVDAQIAERSFATFAALTTDEIATLTTGYADIVGTGETGLQLDYIRADRDAVRRLDALARPVLERVVAEHFPGRVPCLVSFIAKHPGSGTEFVLHRDIAANDERGGLGYTMWIPLVDVRSDLRNGVLEVVPGSERIAQGFTGVDASAALRPYSAALQPLLQPVDLDAGTALVYPARLLHASGANESDHTRLAVACMLAERDRPIVHIEPVGRRRRRVHRVDQEFFVDHHPQELVMSGIPDAYPVIDEFDESPIDVPAAIAAALGLATEPVPAPVVPDDLEPDPTRRGAVPRPPFAVRRTADLAVEPLPAIGATCAGATVGAPRGGVGAAVLRAGRRRAGERPVWLGSGRDTAPGPLDRSLAVVVVDPWARLVLDTGADPTRCTRVDVLDCPTAGSGAVDSVGATLLSPGLRFDLHADTTWAAWNDGPSPVVLLLRERQVPAPLAGPLRRVGRWHDGAPGSGSGQLVDVDAGEPHGEPTVEPDGERTVEPGAEPNAEPLVWLDLDVDELVDHPDLLDRLRRDELVGITVRGVFPAAACADAVADLTAHTDDATHVMFGHVLGRPLLQDGNESDDLTPHLDDAERMRRVYTDLFGFDPHDRLADALDPILGGLEWTAPFDGERRWNPGNLRVMEPESCALPAHAGNQFLDGSARGAGGRLLEAVDAFDHLSYFVVIQQPDLGGELSVFDALWVAPEADDGQGAAFGGDVDLGAPAFVLDPGPGDLILFRAGRRFHQVEPLGPGRQRVTYGGFSAPGRDGRSMRCWS